MKKHLSKILTLALAICIVTSTGATSVFASSSAKENKALNDTKTVCYELDQTQTIKSLKLEKAADKKKIIFDANGGKGKKVTQEIDANSYTYLKKQKFTKSGYSFIGWSTSKKAKASAVLPIDSLASSLKFKSDNTVTVYAQWVKTKKYTITYDLGKYGKMEGKAPKSYTSGSYFALPFPTSKKDGQMFVGWCTSKDKDAEPVTMIFSTTSGNLKLYASFMEFQY